MPVSDKRKHTDHASAAEKVSSKERHSFSEPLYDREMSWWPDLSDLDRLNVMAAPIEDRARVLAAKISGTVEDAMLSISERAKLPYLHAFSIAESPTKLVPLRLIHAFSCLPISDPSDDKITKPTILVLEEDDSINKQLKKHLGQTYNSIFFSESESALIELRDNPNIFAIFVSAALVESNGFAILDEIRDLHPDANLLLLCLNIADPKIEDYIRSVPVLENNQLFRALTKPLERAELDAVKVDLSARRIRSNSSFSTHHDGKIDLLTVWPPSQRMSRWVYAVSGCKPVWHLGSPEQVIRAITENFGIGADSLEESDLGEDPDRDQENQDDLEDQNAAIIRFVNEVVQRAIVDRATDIHFEPHKETLQIRYRIDGQLVPVRVPDNLRSFQDAIISRIKIMAGINISEKRRPQGGRITFTHGQSDLDIRVSTLPTLYGESISLRLLNEKSQPLSMQELGLVASEEKKLVAILEKPHGIVLVTGPTGSGKSTSLTAFIRRIHKPERRIMTVEDPVEYEVSGINQTQVNAEIGFTFASALREILRQDPDVIMVGEIRDRETADIAIRASLTGHLVLSTLHTNDAPGAITRLIDMEIEPFLIASSVEMVMAQRLVRRLCGICAEPTMLSEDDLRATLSLMEIDTSEVIHLEKVLAANGCTECQNLGYRGRVGIFELMRMSDNLHGLIIKSSSAPEIRQVALSEGMTPLQSSGWSQVKRGLTSLEEVVRYADIFVEDESTSGK